VAGVSCFHVSWPCFRGLFLLASSPAYRVDVGRGSAACSGTSRSPSRSRRW
jgi:hypothetical protein